MTIAAEVLAHDRNGSEYFAVPDALLISRPSPAALRRITTTELELVNFLEPVEPELLLVQYDAAVDEIRSSGIEVIDFADLLRDDEDYKRLIRYNPNVMFMRDSIVATAPWLGNVAVMGKMGLTRGGGAEPASAAKGLELIGCDVLNLDLAERDTIEGGDVIPARFDGLNTLIVGIGSRTTEGAAKALIEQVKAVDQVIMIYHPRKALHLDTTFGLIAGAKKDIPNSPGVALLAKGYTKGQATKLTKANNGGINSAQINMNRFLKSHGFQIEWVGMKDAVENEVCNVTALGKGAYLGLKALGEERVAKIQALTGATIMIMPGDEIAKAAGGYHCLTHHLYGQAVRDFLDPEHPRRYQLGLSREALRRTKR